MKKIKKTHYFLITNSLILLSLISCGNKEINKTSQEKKDTENTYKPNLLPTKADAQPQRDPKVNKYAPKSAPDQNKTTPLIKQPMSTFIIRSNLLFENTQQEDYEQDPTEPKYIKKTKNSLAKIKACTKNADGFKTFTKTFTQIVKKIEKRLNLLGEDTIDNILEQSSDIPLPLINLMVKESSVGKKWIEKIQQYKSLEGLTKATDYIITHGFRQPNNLERDPLDYDIYIGIQLIDIFIQAYHTKEPCSPDEFVQFMLTIIPKKVEQAKNLNLFETVQHIWQHGSSYVKSCLSWFGLLSNSEEPSILPITE